MTHTPVSLGPCSRCGEPSQPTHRWCYECKAEYMRRWRQTRHVSAETRRKENARCYAGVYRRRGKLGPEKCEDCGATEGLQMHHDDYSKPLGVRFKCRSCHAAHHGRRAHQ